MSLFWIVRLQVAVPAVLLIPIRAAVCAAVKVINPPSTLPSMLPLILMAEVTAPVLDIAVTAPPVTVLFRFLMVLLVMWSWLAATVFEMAVNAPVPVLLTAIISLSAIVTMPVVPAFRMPLKTDAPVLKTDTFCTVFWSMVMLVVAVLLMALKVQTAVVVTEMPMLMEFAMVALPTVFERTI